MTIHHVTTHMSKIQITETEQCSSKQLVNTIYLFIHQYLFEFVLFFLIISSKQVTGEPHVQIPGRKGAQPPHEILLQYIIYTGNEFKCTFIINSSLHHLTVASACMKIIIKYILAVLVLGVHHSSQPKVSNLTS